MKKIIGKSLKIDPFSLRLRLTVAISTLSALVLGGMMTGLVWKMQRILIDSQKQDIEQIVARFPSDVQIYSEMMQPTVGLEKAIARLSHTDLLIWVRSPDQQIIAESVNFASLPIPILTELMSLSQMPITSEVFQIEHKYYIICGSPLKVEGAFLGQLFVARDITSGQSMLESMVWSLAVIGILAIVVMTIAIALYIGYSLGPLRQLSQMTATISSDNLGQTKLYFSQAPSEVKELVLTLNHLLSRLALSWEREREFTSNVSHELRTPLTIVYGYLQSVLRRPDNLTAIQREALETATAEAERTIRILQDLLDLARGDSGHLPFRIESLPINELIMEVVTMAGKSSERIINIEVPINPIEARVDSSRFKQVLLNLIDNAIKYSEPTTPVTVTLNKLSEKVIIQVVDHGCGIPLAHQSRVFDRFYRVDESRSHATGGCGLGLSIVKMLVEGMGGSVSVESKPGKGSVFTINLLPGMT